MIKNEHDLVMKQDQVQELLETLEFKLNTPLEQQLYIRKLLDIRGEILSQFKPVLETISTIEDGIKALKLPVGTYGVGYPLKISAYNTKEINNKAVFEHIRKDRRNPLDYVKLDTTNAYIKAVLEKNPEYYHLVPGASRHSFK